MSREDLEVAADLVKLEPRTGEVDILEDLLELAVELEIPVTEALWG